MNNKIFIAIFIALALFLTWFFIFILPPEKSYANTGTVEYKQGDQLNPENRNEDTRYFEVQCKNCGAPNSVRLKRGEVISDYKCGWCDRILQY